jgi:hypothetical protein
VADEFASMRPSAELYLERCGGEVGAGWEGEGDGEHAWGKGVCMCRVV